MSTGHRSPAQRAGGPAPAPARLDHVAFGYGVVSRAFENLFCQFDQIPHGERPAQHLDRAPAAHCRQPCGEPCAAVLQATACIMGVSRKRPQRSRIGWPLALPVSSSRIARPGNSPPGRATHCHFAGMPEPSPQRKRLGPGFLCPNPTAELGRGSATARPQRSKGSRPRPYCNTFRVVFQAGSAGPWLLPIEATWNAEIWLVPVRGESDVSADSRSRLCEKPWQKHGAFA